MIVWDQGRWTPLADPRKGYAKGHLDFELHGERLKGRWHLVRMRPRPRRRKSNGSCSRETMLSRERLAIQRLRRLRPPPSSPGKRMPISPPPARSVAIMPIEHRRRPRRSLHPEARPCLGSQERALRCSWSRALRLCPRKPRLVRNGSMRSSLMATVCRPGSTGKG